MIIKMFEEFDPNNISIILDKIGKCLPKFGHAKICFEFGKNSIIKIFQLDFYKETEIVNCIKQKNLNLNILPKIYKIGMIKPKGDNYFNDLFNNYLSNTTIEFDEDEELFFIIEEKVYTDDQLIKDLIYINIEYKNYLNFYSNFIKDIQNDIYKNSFLRKKLINFQKKLSLNYQILFNSIIDIYTQLKNNDVIISDANFDNFGRNKNGDLILFDLDDVFEYGPKKRFDKKDLDYIF